MKAKYLQMWQSSKGPVEVGHIILDSLYGKQKHRVVSMVWVDPAFRGRGIARRLMRQVLKDADEQRVTLYCQPVPSEDSPLNLECLTKWYSRLGFECRYDWVLMRRIPLPHCAYARGA